jgi:peptidoglycan/LPS O-acetylase OafA/YrhL
VRGLDGLRAIAVLAVVIFHASEHWLRGGFLGVDVFFVLSGFLITSQLLVEWRQVGSIDIAAFWRRRARRILAALYLLLGLTLSFAVIFHSDEVAVFRGDALAALAYVANWYFVFHHQPYFEVVAHPSPLLHLWSLGVEEQFYLFWPLILAPALLLLRRWAAIPILLAAAGSAALMALLYRPGMDPSRLYYGTDTHASGLLIGALLAFWWTPAARDGGRSETGSRAARAGSYARRNLAADAAGLAALIVLATLFLGVNESDRLLYLGGFTLVAAVTAAVIVALAHPRAVLVTAALEWAPVRWVGRRSYSIYLWHWPVVVFSRAGMGVPLTGTPLLVVRLIASLALAEASFRFVEEPVRHGGLVELWRRVEEALWSRRWLWLAGAWISAVAATALVSGIGFAVAGAKAPTPPAYLAVGSVDTITRPGTSTAVPLTATAGNLSSTPASTRVAAADDSATTVLSSATDATPAADAVAPVPDPPSAPVSAGRVIALGDSVMLGAVPQLVQDIAGVEVNAAVSRQPVTGIQLLQQLREQGALGQVVVVDLGSNGTFTSAEFDQAMSVLVDVPRVVFVNVKVPRSWQDPNNVVLTQGVRRYQNTRLVDWHAASGGHPEYFQVDEYHLRAEGAAAYAALIAAAVAGP